MQTKFIPNSFFRMCRSSMIFLELFIQICNKYNAIAIFANSIKNAFCAPLMQIRYHKGAGTKMHKCLVGKMHNELFFKFSSGRVLVWIRVKDQGILGKHSIQLYIMYHFTHIQLCNYTPLIL